MTEIHIRRMIKKFSLAAGSYEKTFPKSDYIGKASVRGEILEYALEPYLQVLNDFRGYIASCVTTTDQAEAAGKKFQWLTKMFGVTREKIVATVRKEMAFVSSAALSERAYRSAEDPSRYGTISASHEILFPSLQDAKGDLRMEEGHGIKINFRLDTRQFVSRTVRYKQSTSYSGEQYLSEDYGAKEEEIVITSPEHFRHVLHDWFQNIGGKYAPAPAVKPSQQQHELEP